MSETMIPEVEIERCKAETQDHIRKVAANLNIFIKELINRAEHHDDSKLESPELEGYAGLSTKLKDIEYGSDAYKENMRQLRPVVEHHYAHNRHHIEFHKNGISDMNLVDLVEMLSDWSAALLRNKNGNLRKSLEYNIERYSISPQLAKILENTITQYF